eukprot:3987611-Heterocapsa_arctica.AAC.1
MHDLHTASRLWALSGLGRDGSASQSCARSCRWPGRAPSHGVSSTCVMSLPGAVPRGTVSSSSRIS